jgi:DNA-binding transcriptional LysR family regulator
MQSPHFPKLDLNLLLLFDALMEERSVTRAAERLGMTQAGLSHALARLRGALDDDLLVRRRGTMQPTSRALILRGPLQDALRRLHEVLVPSRFNPAQSQQTFRIVASDYFSTLYLPVLVRRMERTSPGIALRMMSSRHLSIETMLANHEIDLAIGNYKNRITSAFPSEFQALDLYDDPYVCVVRTLHPLARKRLTTDLYLGSRHMHLSPTGNAEYGIERYLLPRGIHRKIELVIDHYLLAPLVLESSDMIWTAPSRVAHFFRAKFDLRLKAMPISIPPARLQLVWKPQHANSPAHLWLRAIIAETVAATPRSARPNN